MRKSVSVAMVSVWALAAGTGVYAQEAPEPRASSGDSGEIVVTAQRREERLQDVPLSISAVSGDALEKAGTSNIEGLATFTPSLTYAEFNASDPNIYIRGIGSHFDGGSLERSVAVFVDDVYLGRAAGGTADIFDLERVEVLRGPQGTLFGKNTVGGAINLISSRPTDTAYFKVNADVGTYGTINVRGVANGALTDDINGRFSFVSRRHDGYAKSALTGSELEDLQSTAVRGAVSSNLGERLEVTVSADYYKRTGNGLNKWAVSKTTDAYTIGNGPDRRTSFVPDGRQDNEAWGTSVRIKYDAGIGDITSITAVRGSQSNIDVALAGIRVDKTRPDISAPFNLTHNIIDERAAQYSQELRFASNFSGPFNFLAGAFLYREVVDRDEHSTIVFRAPIPDQFDDFQTRSKANSIAVFVDGTLNVTDAFSLTAGVRYTHDKKTFRNIADSNRFPTGGFPFDVTGKYSSNATTPRFTAKYQLSPNSMAYATISRGFKAGGFDGQPTSALAAGLPVAPEYVTNYEVGTKNSFFNRKLTLDLSAFHMRYTDLQVQSLVDVPGSTVPITALFNAGKSDINGVEVSGSLALARQTRIGFNYGYLDAKFKSDLVISGVNVNGKYLERAPKHTFGVTLNHTSELSDRFALDVNSGLTYSGKYYSEITNNENAAVDPYAVWDGEIRLRSLDRGWYVGVWAKNITNKYYPTYVLLTANTGFVNYAAPRTIGATFGIEFQ
ncbi:TonB-dependent receptor [Sphingopyxis panaciterrulae]|uniref:Iron complex outermembrane receptor protein n=1 Tax=Sphingopyxis panaciterrulae TaxID=462372 RepID=A0A7W9B806_9SPHN|nr:TonB-dependent receptor [Sphingopyxis panaciterrulae]MBB5707906.1 iron complex outermembrane receptor protein [Sphingopyxis panaciterrulae]